MNDFDSIKDVHWAEIIKPFLITFLPLALFFGSLTFLFYYKDVKSERLTVEQGEFFKVNSQIKVVASKFNSIITDLKFLAQQNELITFLTDDSAEHYDNLSQELLSFSNIKQIYSTIQLIDVEGREMAVIASKNSHPRILEQNQLENKAGERYFMETVKSNPDSVIILPFDYFGSFQEAPLVNPVVLFAMPIYSADNRCQAIIVLHHPIAHLISELKTASSSATGATLLVTPKGYYLDQQLNHEAPNTVINLPAENIQTLLPDEWKTIQKTNTGQLATSSGLVTYATIYPSFGTEKSDQLVATTAPNGSTNNYLWKTISFIPAKELAEWPEKILGRILLLYGVCLFIIGISSLLIARTSVRRRRAEEAMRENEEELRAINEAAANAIIAIDNNKNVLHWNPAAERLFQYSATEVLERPITSIISPPKHQSTFTKMSRKLRMPDADSTEPKTIELFGYKKDGTEFPVEVSFSAFKKNNQWHTVGIIRDISARKQMEQEVLRAQKFESLGVLSSGIAHDFNNLLTAIIGNIDLLDKLSKPTEDTRELLLNAAKAARRAKALTQQLLTFSKDGTPVRKTISIEPIIREAAEFALHGSPIANTLTVPADLYLVDVDAGQIGQVIQNIINNARQAISGSSTIDISCRNVDSAEVDGLPPQLKGNYIELTFSDHGHGIARRHLAKIFEPYFTTRDHGSGLGLTIAHSIIQRHDGHIDVFSEEDQGTTVKVYLPAAVDQHVSSEHTSDNGEENHYTIMVVDSDEMLLNIAGKMLSHLGHQCVCARSAREALDIYKNLWKVGTPVDSVIIDLILPGGMGGKETAGAIFDINSEARIIVSSGFTNDPVMVDFDEYGFCAAIAKPFDMDELAAVIDAVLA